LSTNDRTGDLCYSHVLLRRCGTAELELPNKAV
jgi:hypothetical protein